MKLSMYQASVTAFTRQLNNLLAILDKAAAHADAKKIDPKVLINSTGIEGGHSDDHGGANLRPRLHIRGQCEG